MSVQSRKHTDRRPTVIPASGSAILSFLSPYCIWLASRFWQGYAGHHCRGRRPRRLRPCFRYPCTTKGYATVPATQSTVPKVQSLHLQVCSSWPSQHLCTRFVLDICLSIRFLSCHLATVACHMTMAALPSFTWFKLQDVVGPSPQLFSSINFYKQAIHAVTVITVPQ